MTTSELFRRDPQKGKKEFSKHKGFTIIELMIAVAVIAIITSLALPSYRTIIEKRQVTSGAEQIGAFLSVAQSEAVKRSENLSVSYDRTDNATWCIGFVVGTDACDCSIDVLGEDDENACILDGAIKAISGANLNYPAVMQSMNGDKHFIFDPARGLIYDDDNLSGYDDAEFVLISDNSSYSLNVQISPTGRINYCNNSSAAKKVPGYEPC